MGRKGNLLTHVFSRQIGVSCPLSSSRRISASQGLVERMDLHLRLLYPQGYVNTVEFNLNGDVIVSSSDDGKVALWDWSQAKLISSYDSGHYHNILQARVFPLTDDWIIATSAVDGQVRLSRILRDGRVETEYLGRHEDAAHQLVIEPGGSPQMLYSCGEDGFVQRYDLRCKAAVKLFRCFSATATNWVSWSYVRLNSMVINPRCTNCFAVGGSDSLVRIYDMRICRMDLSNCSGEPVNIFCPPNLVNSKATRLSGLAYSKTGQLLASYSRDFIYLFRETWRETEVLPDQVYTGHGNAMTFKGVSFFGPNDEYVVTGSDCSCIFIWRKKDAKIVRVMVADNDIVNKIALHPHMPFLASCGLACDVKVWSPGVPDTHPLPDNIEQIMEGNIKRNWRLTAHDLNPEVIKQALLVQRPDLREFVQSWN